MWKPLISQTQLYEGARLRQIVHEGNIQHEAVYKASSVGDHYFAIEMIERNGIEIPLDQQSVAPCTIKSVPYLGYEIWVEKRMEIKKEKEETIEWTDNSSRFQNIDIISKLEKTDKLEKVDNSSVRFLIFLKLTLWTRDSDKVFSGVMHGQYIVKIESDMTLDDLSFFYKRIHSVFKVEFDNYKKGKSLEPVLFPEFKEDSATIVSAFKDRIFDTLSSN